MLCWSFNEPTSPIHWSCTPKKPSQPSSPLARTPHTVSQLQQVYVATRLSSNAVMYVWWISSDPLKYALESLRSEVPGIQKTFWIENSGNWRTESVQHFPLPFCPFSHVFHQQAGNGAWVRILAFGSQTLFCLHPFFYWMSNDHRGNTSSEQRMFQNGIYCSQTTVSLFSHSTSTEARKERIKQ